MPTLGTPHLDELPDSFRPAMPAPLLDRLVAGAPNAILTENVSGLRCAARAVADPARWAESVERWCLDPAAGGAAANLGGPAANAEAERGLAAWPAAPTVSDPRRLALPVLAAGAMGSAVVQ